MEPSAIEEMAAGSVRQGEHTVAVETGATQGTVIAHDPAWRLPVIPVVAGITGWAFIADGAFHRWSARPGTVVLGMWQHDYHWRGGPERGEDEIAASDPPLFEVPMPIETHHNLLYRLMAMGRGTLAVLEFRGGEDEPPDWGALELGTDGLAEALRRAGILEHDALLARRAVGGEG